MRRSYTGLPAQGNPGIKTGKNWTPMLRIRVAANHQQTPVLSAVVDSGSPYCLFRMDVANFLHLDLRSAPTGRIGGVIGGPKDLVYFHTVNVVIETNWTISVYAGFMKKLSTAAILGRGGFFDRFQVLFDHSTSPPEFEINKIDLEN